MTGGSSISDSTATRRLLRAARRCCGREDAQCRQNRASALVGVLMEDGLPGIHTPGDNRVANYSDAVRVGNHDGAFQKAGLFHPGCARHLAIAVQGEPSGKNLILRILSAGQDGSYAGADGTCPNLERSLTRNQCGVTYFDALHVGDGIQWPRLAVERDSEVASSRLGTRCQRSCAERKKQTGNECCGAAFWHPRSPNRSAQYKAVGLNTHLQLLEFGGGQMENWKKALLAGSAGASALLFLKGKPSAGLILAGVGLATLASEYPEKFAEFRENLPDYVDRGTSFLNLVSRAGERLAEAAERRGSGWYEALLRG